MAGNNTLLTILNVLRKIEGPYSGRLSCVFLYEIIISPPAPQNALMECRHMCPGSVKDPKDHKDPINPES